MFLFVRFLFVFIFLCSLVTAPLHQNWLTKDMQGVNDILATSSQPGTACDSAFADSFPLVNRSSVHRACFDSVNEVMFIVSFAQPPARARRAFQVSITQRAPFPLPRSSWQPAGRFVVSEERSSLVGRTEGVSSLPAMLVRRLDQKCRPSNVRRTAAARRRRVRRQ